MDIRETKDTIVASDILLFAQSTNERVGWDHPRACAEVRQHGYRPFDSKRTPHTPKSPASILPDFVRHRWPRAMTTTNQIPLDSTKPDNHLGSPDGLLDRSQSVRTA